ncbi:MAG: amino acid ABC transporter permease [Bacillota bacterium]|nr:amino acid ABC transporter permease [Bacillota bacterium]
MQAFEKYRSLRLLDSLQFLRGIGVTLEVTLLSIAIGTFIGIILGIIRCSKNKAVSSLPLIYIEPLRNSPLVTQLFLVYYGIPMITNWMPSAFTCAVLTLSLNTGAFFAVLVNNSIKAIPQGQWEAGYALGHGKTSVFIHFIVPQAFRLLIPQAVTLYIGQLQCSSYVALISLIDLTKTGETISLRTMMPFVCWGIVFALYFIISFPLSKLAQYLEKKNEFAY